MPLSHGPPSTARPAPLVLAVALLLSAVLAPSPALAAEARRPRALVDTTLVPPSGRIVVVQSGADLQGALDRAERGDALELAPGATYVGPFVLPQKTGEGWITIRSSALAQAVPEGTRVTPAHAALMPRIVGGGVGALAIETAPGAHHYRFVGIEFLPGRGLFTKALIRLGTGEETELRDLPHDIIIDRCYVHGDPTVGGRRGIALNSRSTAVIDSYVSDWKEIGADSQALAGWNGPGPFRIANNYLEAAGENVMFGGADPGIDGLVPSDIEVVGNHLAKPLAWRGSPWTVKNLFELKSARRVLVEGNLFENNWAAAQNGTAIVIKSVNQDGGAEWSVTEDVTFVGNIVRHTATGIGVCGRGDGLPAGQTARILIADNLLYDVDAARWGGAGRVFTLLEDVADLKIEHNTVDADGDALIMADGLAPQARFVFRNNIAPRNDYGIKGSDVGEGLPTLERYFPGYRMGANVVAGPRPSARTYPPGTRYAETMDAVGFVNRAAGNYRLAPHSPFRGAATDGRDPGADFERVSQAAAAVTVAHAVLPDVVHATVAAALPASAVPRGGHCQTSGVVAGGGLGLIGAMALAWRRRT
jgi:hypothetical protein